MKRFQKTLYTAIIISEFSHVFCCVLPTIFSVLSLLVGLGMVTLVPVWLQNLHGMLHGFEIPMIILSGFVVALGWALHLYSNKIDCHDTGCGHGPCDPAKDKAHTVLKIATILFIANVSIYMVFHRGMHIFAPNNQVSTIEQTQTHNH